LLNNYKTSLADRQTYFFLVCVLWKNAEPFSRVNPRIS
jgi:hypothetical protein